MTNVIPGDRAVIIGHDVLPNVGRIVEVIREYRDGEVLEGDDTPYRRPPGAPWAAWVVAPLSGGALEVMMFRKTAGRWVEYQTVKRHVIAIADIRLRRLPRPGEMPEEDLVAQGRPVESADVRHLEVERNDVATTT